VTAAEQNRLAVAWTFHRAGEHARADHLYREILRLEPRNYDALYLLGVLCSQTGRFGEAKHFLGEASRVRPNADVHVALGYALQRLERHAEALACYDRALKENPNLPDIALPRGIALSNLRRHAEALVEYEKAVASRPGDALAWHARGSALLELGRSREALESFDKTLTIRRDNAETWRNRALALLQLNQPQAALDSLDRAISLAPDYVDALIDRAGALLRFRRHEEAYASYSRALALRPNDVDLLYNFANTLLALKRFEESIAVCEKVLAMDPHYPYARGVLIDSKLQSCDWHRMEKERQLIAEGVRGGRRIVSPFNFKALSDSAAEQLQCARLTTKHEFPPSPTPLAYGKLPHRDRIRVAYVSGDLNHTVVASLAAGVFESHDRSRFEVFGIGFGSNAKTAMRTRLEAAFEHFIDVSERTDRDVAQLLHERQIDIVVDLMGSTGDCRTGIFAHRPCAIQVNFLGFAGSMGAPYFDYIIADRTVIPESERPHYDERVVYLPHCYLPHDSKRAVSEWTPERAEAGLPDGSFVFCSFNSTYKFTPEMFDIWMSLLRQTEGSVLWLPQSNPAAMKNLRQQAVNGSVAAERIVFAPQIPRSEDHLARLRLADLFLDTSPYNAHATASDALWAGLPLLTCAGRSFASRVAASLLTAAGMTELIVDSLDAYERRALELARDKERLGQLRQKLARQRLSAPLFDTVGYTRDLEAAYAGMYERYQRGESSSSFAVGEHASR
jgi:predicted O-linked N-acetylglucosamine transferase (SPINDLY family)